jgi:hypothetical protein
MQWILDITDNNYNNVNKKGRSFCIIINNILHNVISLVQMSIRTF